MSEKGLPASALEVVASIAQHRTLTAAQVQLIHFPGRSRRWVQSVLARLTGAGLLEHARLPTSPAWLWFVTQTGADWAGDAGVLSDEAKILTPKQAVGQLHAHTLAVSDAAACFLTAAANRGDEFGPFSWRHEVAHSLSNGRGRHRRRVVADAVLTYVLSGGDLADLSVAQRFLELDRNTLPIERFTAELARYADLFRAEGSDGEPIWRAVYPRFPAVLCVLAGGDRGMLQRRRMTALALLRADPRLTRTPEVPVSIVLLDDLRERGPFAPIFDELRQPGERVDWLGRADPGAA